MHRRREQEAGFTLVELMAVVLVIGVLLAIAIPTFVGARSRGQDAVAETSVATTLTAAGQVGLATGFDDVDAEAMAAEEGALAFLDGEQPSTGPKEVSVAGSPDGVVAVARSESGSCFVGHLTASGRKVGQAPWEVSPCRAGSAPSAEALAAHLDDPSAPTTEVPTTTVAPTTTTTTSPVATSVPSPMRNAFVNRLRNLGNAGANRLYAGPNASADGYPNRAQALGSRWASPGTSTWTVSYDPGTDRITQTVSGIGSVTYQPLVAGVAAVAPTVLPSSWNVAQLVVANRTPTTTIRVTGATLSGPGFATVALPDQVPAGGTTSSVYAFGALHQGFTFTATVELAGAFPSSQELNKLELWLGATP